MDGNEAAPKGKSTVLTRAARRKAGVPPPTPLFRGVSSLQSLTEHAHQTETSSTEEEPVSPSLIGKCAESLIVSNEANPKRKSTVLTRAARRKAGVPPPTPLFRGVSSLQSLTEHAHQTETSSTEEEQVSPSLIGKSCDSHMTLRSPGRAKPKIKRLRKRVPRKLSRPPDSDTDSTDSECVRGVVWVQCDREGCGKWRKLPTGTMVDQSKDWYCRMHPDPTCRSCDQPEERWRKPKKRAFTFTRLEKGSLVWAKMAGYPKWPAIVSPDPWSAMEYVTEEREGCIYHVEFLGKCRTHIWIQEEKIEPYRPKSSTDGRVKHRSKATTVPKTQKLLFAISEANSLLQLSNEQRLAECVFKELTPSSGRVKTEPGADKPKRIKTEKKDLENKSDITAMKPGPPAKVDDGGSSKLAEKTDQVTRIRGKPATGIVTATVSPGQFLKCFGIERNGSTVSTEMTSLLQSLQTHLVSFFNTTHTKTTDHQNTAVSDPVLGRPQARSKESSGFIKQLTSRKAIPTGTSTDTQRPSALKKSPSILTKLPASAQGAPSTIKPRSKSQTKRTSLTARSLTLISPDRLVQTGLGTTSSNMVQVVPVGRPVTGKSRRRKVKRSPCVDRAQNVSPSIVDYFRKDGGRGSLESQGRGGGNSVHDQRVPSLAPQESPLSGQLEEETLTVEGELREIQDLLSMFTQPHPPQDVGVARSCESNPRQTHEEGPTASTMLSQSSKQSTQTGNSTPVSPYEGALVTGVEESPLVECAETQAGEVMSGASVGIPDTGGMFKDVEFDSVLSELQCIEDMIQDLTDQQVPSC